MDRFVERTKRLVRQLEALGHHVTLDPQRSPPDRDFASKLDRTQGVRPGYGGRCDEAAERLGQREHREYGDRGDILHLRSRARRSVTTLNTDIRAWSETWTENPQPVACTKTAAQILDSVIRTRAENTQLGR